MHNIRRAYTTVAAILLTGPAATAARAAPDPGSISTAAATVAFSQTVSITHTLTADHMLPLALPDRTRLATGHIATADGAASYFAMRWTPGTTVGRADGIFATIPGTGDPAHILQVYIPLDARTTDNVSWTHTTVMSSKLDYEVRSLGDQTVAVDSYVLSIDAAVWKS